MLNESTNRMTMEVEVQKDRSRRVKVKAGGMASASVHPKRLNLAAIENSTEIQAWLSQFTPENQAAAKCLLMKLSFVTRDDYSNWLKEALQSLPANEPCAVYAVRKAEKKVKKIDYLWDVKGNVVNRPGTTLGSEDLVYSLVSNVVRSNEKRFFDHPSLGVLKKKKIHNIVLIDDSIGSGDRVSGFIKSMMAHKSFRSWWSFGFINIIVLSFARTIESKKAIIEKIPGSNHGKRKHPVSSKIRFVSEIVYSKIWLKGRWGPGYEAILNSCDSKAKILKWPRGYGDVMGNIVFYHSVPNNIPGVLFECKNRWRPLFPGRSVPDWLTSLIDNQPSLSKDDMLRLLSLIKSGVRRHSSLALRMDRDNEVLKEMLRNVIDSGLVLPNIRITEAGIRVLRQRTGRSDSRQKRLQKIDRALYIPKSWCADQVTIQPPDLGEETPWKQADPAEVFTSAGGEAGQVSMERSDARAVSPPLSVRSQLPSKSRKGPDNHGPMDSKDKCMEAWSVHHLFEKAQAKLGPDTASDLQKYAHRLINTGLPVIFSLGHFAKITNSDYKFLRDTIERKRELANYKMFAVKKRSGGRRFIHAVSGKLMSVQQFINAEILQKVFLHPCSFAFHRNGGIGRCAASHCGARWLFQYDLSDFFYDITEVDVFSVFERLGYRKLLYFELARLCTTTHLPRHLKCHLHFKKSFFDKNLPYKGTTVVGVLPQGAPTSPMLSNLAAEKLDKRLNDFAFDNGFVFSRYADDLTLSARRLPQNMSIGEIHRKIVCTIRECGFKENRKKIRIAGPGSKKIVLGLLVDGEQPRISREMYKRIDRHLHAAMKFGIADTAKHEDFDSAYGFYNHLSGLISFVKDVDKKRWSDFHERFSKLTPSWVGVFPPI
jgi:RNA-directed DNA polymerase